MRAAASSLDQMVTALVPSLSSSLAEHFNVFRVMHHGTHEKQLSNVFAWLLRLDATHNLGDTFQQIFVKRVVGGPVPIDLQLPMSGYRVTQEVDTSGPDALGEDIADIELTTARTCIVVENFEASDGHGHDYYRYLAHGAAGGRLSVVVLLCDRREPHCQTNGWEHAAVVTYAELLTDLQRHIEGNAAWRRANPEQHFFITQLVNHFVEGTGNVSSEDRISFIKTMCETGESARYGYRPHETAAEEFATLLARHAKRQFEEGRATLGRVKRKLKSYAEHILVAQLNDALLAGRVTAVQARFVGQWEWCVTLERDEPEPNLFLVFGPTAVVENSRAPETLPHPDYTRVFVARHATGHEGIDRIIQTEVGLDEILAGLSSDDTRLRDAVVAAIRAG